MTVGDSRQIRSWGLKVLVGGTRGTSREPLEGGRLKRESGEVGGFWETAGCYQQSEDARGKELQAERRAPKLVGRSNLGSCGRQLRDRP